MTSVSALIMAADEEQMLPGCLATLTWADEIVVLVDDRTSDDTAAVARRLGARVYVEPWRGFSGQRDRLAELASGEWLLYVDADERVTPPLANEIRAAAGVRNENAFRIASLNVFLGHPMRYGGWWPDSHLRLIRSGSLQKWQGAIHEAPSIDGAIGALEEPLVHLGHRDLRSMLLKTAKWAPIEAERRVDNAPPVTPMGLLAPIARDVKWRLLRARGWRDGTAGWIEIIYQAFSAFLSIAFLWELQRSERLETTYRRLDEHLQGGGSVAEFFDQRPTR